MLTREVQELQDTKGDKADAAKLVQALESEKLGASRAVLQNQQLKQQLTEMENAFVTLVSHCPYYCHVIYFNIILLIILFFVVIKRDLIFL